MALRNLTEGLTTESDAEQIAMLLMAILNRLGFNDPTQGAMRVQTSANSVITTVSTVTTLSTLTNQTQTGGLFTNNDQQVQFAIAAGQNRNKIVVT